MATKEGEYTNQIQTKHKQQYIVANWPKINCVISITVYCNAKSGSYISAGTYCNKLERCRLGYWWLQGYASFGESGVVFNQ